MSVRLYFRNVFRSEEENNVYAKFRAVPRLRSLVAGLSPRRLRFAPGLFHVRFVVDKAALGQLFLRVGFPLSIYHSTVAFQTHIIWGMRNILT
jgi:hypothetical protein